MLGSGFTGSLSGLQEKRKMDSAKIAIGKNFKVIDLRLLRH
jgi:hypothetical protein